MQRRPFGIERLLDYLGHVHTAVWIATGAGGVMAVIVRVIGSLWPHSGWFPQAFVFAISVAMVYVGLRLQERKIRSAVLNASVPHADIPPSAELATVKPIPSEHASVLTDVAFAKPLSIPPEPAHPTASTPQIQSGAPSKGEDRIIVDIPPADLTKLYSLYTGVQADRLAAIYIKKWMRVTGPLGDAHSFDSFIQVTFEPLQYGIRFLYMYFGIEWFERLSVLRRGSTINVLGRIRNIEPSAFHLENCELTEDTSSLTSQT